MVRCFRCELFQRFGFVISSLSEILSENRKTSDGKFLVRGNCSLYNVSVFVLKLEQEVIQAIS